MGVFIRNANTSVGISLTALRLVGFWSPRLSSATQFFYNCYTLISFMFLLGTYLIIQVVDMFLSWGDIALMTATAYLLFTNLAQAAKIITILCRRERIQRIIEDADRVLTTVQSGEARDIVEKCDRETKIQLFLYFCVTAVTTTGWAASAEKNQLPLRAWYPYDTFKSPAYELTYVHQVGALFIAAFLNVGKDSLVSALIAQCQCRLKLLGLALSSLTKDVPVGDKDLFTPEQEAEVASRLRGCVLEHQAVLEAAKELQACFSEPTFAQFIVSLIIICVTAFQMVSVMKGNIIRLLSMGTYLLNMTFQVFIYCYQGTQLSEESSKIAGAAYTSAWYQYSVSLRGTLLIVMLRSQRVAKLTAGGFTTLSLDTFMAIIKASYSLFTLLQQVEMQK